MHHFHPDQIVQLIQSFGVWGYFVIFLIFFGEALVGIGLIIPGAIIAFLLGAFAAKGMFSIQDLLIFGSLGFFVGDFFSFWLGRKGAGLFKKDNKVLKLEHLEKGQEYFKEHGNKSVIIGRYIGVLRPLTPFIAGVIQMGWLRFLILNTIGIVSWLAIHLLAGFFFGQALWLIKLWSGRLEIMLIYLASFLGVFYLSKRLIIKNGRELFKLLLSIWSTFKDSLKANHDLQRFIDRHQTFFGFWQRRFDTENFSGKKLTILSAIFIYLAYSFIVLTNNVFDQGSLWSIDQRIENLMRTFKNFFFIKILLAATTLASWQIALVLAIAVSFALFLRGREKSLPSFWLAILGSFGTTALIKLFVTRPRPLESFYLETSYSFPSTHSAIAVTLFGFLAYFYAQRRSLKKSINGFFLAILMVITIGFSRIYLRVHFLSDVLAGYLIGAAWLTIGIGLNQYMNFKTGKNFIKRRFETKYRLIALIITLFAAGTYAGFLGYYSSRINFRKLEPTPEVVTTDIIATMKQYDLSGYSESFDGDQQEPINLIVAASSSAELIQAFDKIGWQLADKPNFKALLTALKEGLLIRPYYQLPIAPSFWETEVNDLAFTKQLGNERHYAKFWETSFQTPNGKDIFVGIIAAKRPTKLIIKKTLNPNIDGEREAIFALLSKNKQIASWSRVQFNQPTIVKSLMSEYFTDGKLYIIDLR